VYLGKGGCGKMKDGKRGKLGEEIKEGMWKGRGKTGKGKR
jgi:hypothetical protein